MPVPDPSQMPAPATVRDAVVGPLVDAAGPAMLAGIAATPGCKLEHLRGDGPEGVVDRLEVRAPTIPSVETLEAALYGGPVLEHFGHLVAECIHRLWAAHRPECAGLPVLLQVRPGENPWRLGWFGEVMALCGLDRGRIRIVDAPVAVRRLVVPKQGRVLGGQVMLPGYPALFPLTPLPRVDGGERLYISRAGHLHAGSYLGERLVEAILCDAGFAILRPEAMTVADLVARLASATTIVFAEGSAIHNLELCGPVAARVFVIGRRIGTKRRFGRVLESLVADWHISPAGEAVLTLDWQGDRPRLDRGCSVPDLPALVASLADFTGMDLPVPDAAAARRGQADDLLRFLLHPDSGRLSDDACLGRALRTLRQSPLIGPLIGD